MHEPLIVSSLDTAAKDANLTGGKGSSLAVLAQVPLDEGTLVRVPAFFVVTTHAFARHVRHLHPRVAALQQVSDRLRDQDSPEARELVCRTAKELRVAIRAVDVQQELHDAVAQAYKGLCEGEVERSRLRGSATQSSAPLAVAVRSSATTEDLEEGSFAGQHSSYLNQMGVTDVVQAVRRCWASVFSDRAVVYRSELGVPHDKAVMAVVIQRMIRPLAAGTAFSVEIGTGFPGLHVAASFGLGESLVSGEVTSDEWLLSSDRLQIIKQVRGSKRFQYRSIMPSDAADSSSPATSGLQRVEVSAAEAASYCLDTATVKQIAQQTRDIAAFYREHFGYDNIDTEFAVSTTSNTLYFLQARPVVAVLDNVTVVDPKSVVDADIVLRGAYSLLGACHGKVKCVRDFDALVRKEIVIEPDDIVVAVKTSNYWNQFLSQLRGLVTVEGSPTAHPMLISRERSLQCVIGCPGALEALEPYDGQWITLDGMRKCCHLGRKPLRQATADELIAKFKAVEPVSLQPDDVSFAFLQRFERVVQHTDGNWYTFNVAAPLCPLLQRLFHQAYEPRRAILEACLAAHPGSQCTHGDDGPLAKSLPDPERWGTLLRDNPLVLQGKVCTLLQPLETTLGMFAGMTAAQCAAFVASYARSGDALSQQTDALVSEPAMGSHWRAWCDALVFFSAHVYLSWFFRTYVDQRTSRCAHNLGVTQFHMDRLSDHLLSDTLQLDEVFATRIHELALRVIGCAAPAAWGAAASAGVELSRMPPELQTDVRQLACEFRLTKDVDFRAQPPTDELWARIVAEARRCVTSMSRDTLTTSLTKSMDAEQQVSDQEDLASPAEPLLVEFYPEHTQGFLLWAKVAIEARVMHCNAHHIRLRSLWRVRDLLLNRLGDEAFDMTVDQVAQALEEA